MATHLTDPNRLRALERSGLWDEPPEERFARLVRIATAALRTPVGVLSLVGAELQRPWVPIGVPEAELAGDWSTAQTLCRLVVEGGRQAIDDLRANPLTRENPFVTRLGLRAYLGAPVITGDHQRIAVLCAIDVVPRAWSVEDIGTMDDVSRLVAAQVEATEVDQALAAVRADGVSALYAREGHRYRFGGLVARTPRRPAACVTAVRPQPEARGQQQYLVLDGRRRARPGD